MTVALTPEMEHLIASKVQSGQFASPSEVIHEGLLRLASEDTPELHLEKLRREIAVGIEQADNGQTRPFDAERILSRVHQHLAEG